MDGKVGDATYTAEVELGGLLLALDDLRLDRAHVAGWSNGAKLALHLALAHPGRVRSLTLIEPAAPWVLESAGEPVADFGKDEAHRRAGRQVTDDDLASFLVSAGVVPAEWDRAAIEASPVWAHSSPLRNALSWTFPATWGNHHVDELASIACATLVVRGSDTAPSLKAIAALVADRIPGANLLELPGGHACHLENAEAFVTALRRHLDDADGATTA
jgi:pimeloyl-ACP methyl ester carboxylesterase